MKARTKIAVFPLVIIGLITLGALFIFSWAAELISDTQKRMHISSDE